MTASLPLWGLWLQALGPTCVAGAVAFIAWRQWKTAKEKLTLDLFKERFDIYIQIADAVELSRWEKTAAIDACERIFAAKRRCRFLFGDDVTSIVDEIAGLAFDVKAFVELRDNEAFRESAAEILREQSFDVAEHPIAMRKALDRLAVACESYMRITSKAE